MNWHTGSREDGLGSDGEEDESDDLDLYLGLNMDEVCTKNKNTQKRMFNYPLPCVIICQSFIQLLNIKIHVLQ